MFGFYCSKHVLQLVLSDLLCEENKMCVNSSGEHPNVWYIWFLLLIFLVALLCGVVLFCLQCWLKGPMIHTQRRTVAVFAVGDLDTIYALVTIAKIWNQPRCPSVDDWIKKMWYLYTTEFYAATRKNDITPFVRK
ncbi:transmembrane protein 207 isoform 3-T3 [Thomomys bottae]